MAKNTMKLAKEIRKEGESWKNAVARAVAMNNKESDSKFCELSSLELKRLSYAERKALRKKYLKN